MNVFGIGLPEMAVIAAIGLLVFGPKRLPELGKTLGKTLRGFQSASQEFEKEFRQAVTPESETVFSPATHLEAARPAAPLEPSQPQAPDTAAPAGRAPVAADPPSS